LAVSELGIYADARFPGRSLLAYRNHAENLDELPKPDLAALWNDAITVGSLLRSVVGATRINYAVLGNVERHLHIHIIPRKPELEPLPTRSAWSDPRPLRELGQREYSYLAEKLSAGLKRSLSQT
jgi:diadenosine tetraphosphate (Ap4A) HIT family hydrolase